MRTRTRTLATAVALALAATMVVASPASAHPVLNISASPTTVTAGSTTTITITGTSNGNYTNARIEVFSSTPSTGGTTGNLTAFTSNPVCAGTPATPTCTENPSTRYRLGGINLTSGQAFSYTLTVAVDAGTAAGTFTTKAQFYKSDNTTDGPRTGPLITVTNPTANLGVTIVATGGLFGASATITVTNNGPGALTTAVIDVEPLPHGQMGSSGHGGAATCVSDGMYGELDCTIGPLAASASAVFTINYFTNEPLAVVGPVNFVATRQSSTPSDPNPANDTATDTCTVLLTLAVLC